MVYIEIILLVNALIHVCLVKNTNLILSKKTNKKVLLLSTLITTFYMFFFLIKPSFMMDIKIIAIIFISIISFINNRKHLILGSILYLSKNFMLGGFAQILYNIINFNIIHLLSLLVLVTAITYLYKEYTRYDISLNNLNYKVKIVDNNKTYYLNAYCDTGNFLTDEYFIPVIFLNDRYEIGSHIKDIHCDTVSITKRISLYKVDSFYILINNKYIKRDVYIAYSNINKEVLFGVNLLGG